MADNKNELTWSIDNRGFYKIHERSGHRRIAPRNSDEATRFVAATDLLNAAEEILNRWGHSIFIKYVAKDEFAALRAAVAKAKGQN